MPKLPKVSVETFASVAREIASNKSFLRNVFMEIRGDNPNLAIHISELINILRDEKVVLMTATSIYKLLKSQAEADDLKEKFILE